MTITKVHGEHVTVTFTGTGLAPGVRFVGPGGLNDAVLVVRVTGLANFIEARNG